MVAVVAVFFWFLIAVGSWPLISVGFYFFIFYFYGLILEWVLVKLLAGFDCEGGVWF